MHTSILFQHPAFSYKCLHSKWFLTSEKSLLMDFSPNLGPDVNSENLENPKGI